MLFDTHAHYYAEAFDPDRDAVLSALPAAGVGLVLCPGCDLDTSRQSIQLAEAYPHVYAAAGVHPEDALGLPVDWLDQVAEMTRHPKVKAIGEIGLDYYWKEVPRDLQKEVFRAQLQLAKVLDLPVIVHDREAHGDSLEIVKEFLWSGSWWKPTPPTWPPPPFGASGATPAMSTEWRRPLRRSRGSPRRKWSRPPRRMARRSSPFHNRRTERSGGFLGRCFSCKGIL